MCGVAFMLGAVFMKSAYENITELLVKLGNDQRLKGFAYAQSGLMKLLECDEHIKNYSELYNMVAQEFSTTDIAVEKALRDSINQTWSNRDREFAYSVFGRTLQGESDVPSCKLYMAVLAEWIRYNR